MKILYLFFFLIIFKNISAIEIFCKFEEVYQNGEIQQGFFLVKDNKFREDLYHRLNVMPIELSSLSSRTEDIPLLIDYFKMKLSDLNGVQTPNIDIKNDSLYIL